MATTLNQYDKPCGGSSRGVFLTRISFRVIFGACQHPYLTMNLTLSMHSSVSCVLKKLGQYLPESQEKLKRFEELNHIAIDQSNSGLSKPLDLKSMLERIEQRTTFQGKILNTNVH